MQIQFDPHNEQDVALVRQLIGAGTVTTTVPYMGEEIASGHAGDDDDQSQQSQVDSAAVFQRPEARTDAEDAELFAGNGTPNNAANAKSSQVPVPTGGESADPAQQGGHPPALEFDSAGIPWDERIHAETKATNKDGTWRNKRKVDKEYLKQVTDELRAQHSDVSQATVPPAPGAGTDQQQAAVPPAPTGGNVPPAPATGTVTTFPEFMKAVIAHTTQHGITMVDVNNVLNETMGITSTTMLAQNTDRIPEALANLGIQ